MDDQEPPARRTEGRSAESPDAPAPIAQPSAPEGPLRALRHPNFRLYFFGQAVSLLGTWVQQVALGWLVYRLTGSALLLGTVAFLSQAPLLVLAPIAGIWIDRYDRRRLMLAVQWLMMLLAGGLAALTYLEAIAPWHIVALALALGVLNSFDAPVRQALVVQLVDDRADLANAIALNSFTFNSARFVGPPLAGLLLALTSEAVCFALNALSFAGVILALSRVRIPAHPHIEGGLSAALREGIGYAWTTYPIRALLLNVVLVNLLATPYVALMPIFAKDVFQGGPQTLGWLLGAAGCGSLCAAIYLMVRRSVLGLTRTIAAGGVLAAAALIGFSLTAWLPLALALLFVVGFGAIVTNASTNTVLQTIVPDPIRGRIVSFYTAAVLGTAAVGGLAAGAVAERIGAPLTLLGQALLLLVASMLFVARLDTLRRHIRPIYAALGLSRK